MKTESVFSATGVAFCLATSVRLVTRRNARPVVGKQTRLVTVTNRSRKKQGIMARNNTARKTANKAANDTAHELIKVTNKETGTLAVIPLSLVDFDSFPNCRSEGWQGAETGNQEGGTTYKELKDSIESSGQKDPITVRIKANPKKGTPPYECVKGYRRGKAIAEIAEKAGNPNPTIKVIVKELTDLEAEEENVFENTARDNLSAPDVAFAAYNLLQRYKAQGVNMSVNQLATRMGKNQSYLNMLVKIVNDDATIAQKWRTAPVSVPVKTIASVAKLDVAADPEARNKAFELAKQGKWNPKTNKPIGSTEPPSAKKTAIAAVKRNANMLGRMAALGFLGIKPKYKETWTGPMVVELGVEKWNDLKPEEQTEVCRAGLAAYDEAFSAMKEAQHKAKVASEESGEDTDE